MGVRVMTIGGTVSSKPVITAGQSYRYELTGGSFGTVLDSLTAASSWAYTYVGCTVQHQSTFGITSYY
jgi:hypothetical protein